MGNGGEADLNIVVPGTAIMLESLSRGTDIVRQRI
jgi:hypothetical protein